MSLPSTEVKSLQETIKERLSGKIEGLIPEEVWNKMIEQEFNSLMVVHSSGFNDPITGERIQVSRMDYLIRKEICDFLQSKIREEIRSPEFAPTQMFSNPDGSYILTNERIENAIKMAAPDLLNILVSKMFTQVTMNIMQDIRNNRY